MKKSVAIIGVLLVAVAMGAFWLTQRQGPETRTTPPAATTPSSAEAEAGDQSTAQADSEPEPEPKPETSAQAEPAPKTEAKTRKKDFCERDFGDSAAREADVAALKAQGGLVHIFEREGRLADPYGCADFYLAHGLDVNAVDPRVDREPLTGLHFAIKRNDPKMLRFMIDHGADLNKRASEKDIKPMGYAYFLAFNDTRINRNEIIAILDTTLTRQAGDPGKN